MNRRWVLFFVTLSIVILTVGCQSNQPINPITGDNNTPTLTPELPQNPVQVTSTPQQPTQSPTATTVPSPQPIEAEISAATLNLRSGPGMLHNIINQYQKGAIVTVIARAPGNEWVKVLAKDNKIGWMFAAHLVFKQNIDLVPVYEINESLVIRGKVVNASGAGIPGVQVGITRLGGGQRVRVEGISQFDGSFYAYAPVEYQGTWLASVLSVDCKSPIVDTNCRYAGVFEPAAGFNLTLPTSDEVVFTYK